MLVLGRKPGETVYLEIPNIGRTSITVTAKGIAIDAPKEVEILRAELLKDTIN